MSMMQHIATASTTAETDVLATLVKDLETEFGMSAGRALAHRFLEAEEPEFIWDARFRERWLGAYDSLEEEDLELDRVAICGRLGGRWFAAVMLVDGEGRAQGMIARRFCRDGRAARTAMANAR